MTLTLELNADLETRLRDNATRAGLDPTSYLQRLIEQDVSPANLPVNPSEADAYWDNEGVYGLFADGPDSLELAREFRRQAETRQ